MIHQHVPVPSPITARVAPVRLMASRPVNRQIARNDANPAIPMHIARRERQSPDEIGIEKSPPLHRMDVTMQPKSGESAAMCERVAALLCAVHRDDPGRDDVGAPDQV